MRSEEITADIPEEETPEETVTEEMDTEEEAPEETVAEETAAEEEIQEDTVTEETDTGETLEETVTEETDTEEEPTQEETATKKDTIQDREEMPETSWKEAMTEYTDTTPASDLEYDVFEQILAEQQAANTLLVRITNQNDLFLGIGVALIICCICYSVLERFTRF